MSSQAQNLSIHSGFQRTLIRPAASASEVTTVYGARDFDYYAPPLIGGGIKRWFCLTSDVGRLSDVCQRLSVAYIGAKSRTVGKELVLGIRNAAPQGNRIPALPNCGGLCVHPLSQNYQVWRGNTWGRSVYLGVSHVRLPSQEIGFMASQLLRFCRNYAYTL